MPLPEEAELLAKLRTLYDEYERLNRKISLTVQRRKTGSDPAEIARAEEEEQAFLKEINRLMDRMRAVEGALMKVRGKTRPLMH